MVYKFKGADQKEQGQNILALCNQSDEIICGTDPDREGQGIFDTFAQYYKIQKPTKRLWATSLTEKDLLKSWNKMKKMEEYKNLSVARELRAVSDWLVGMNATRAYSIIAKTSLPIGRVLTSTLALIVQRDLEVENYKETFFYQLKGSWNGIEFRYFDDGGNKIDFRELLDTIRKECEGRLFSLNGFKAEKKTKTENPPKTFNLPGSAKGSEQGNSVFPWTKRSNWHKSCTKRSWQHIQGPIRRICRKATLRNITRLSERLPIRMKKCYYGLSLKNLLALEAQICTRH